VQLLHGEISIFVSEIKCFYLHQVVGDGNMNLTFYAN